MFAYKAYKINKETKEVKAKNKNVSGLKVGTNGMPKSMSVDGTEMSINFKRMIHHTYKMTYKGKRNIFLSAKETG